MFLSPELVANLKQRRDMDQQSVFTENDKKLRRSYDTMSSHSSVSGTFHNGDACGDLMYEWESNNKLQTINSISNIFFLISGYLVIYKSKSHNMQRSGLSIIITGILSCVYHSNSKSSGFVLDVLGMIIWGISLMFNAFTLFRVSPFRALVLSSMIGLYILLTVHYLIETGYSPVTVWYIWSFHFAAMMVTASAIPMYVGWQYNMINAHYIKRILVAILMIGIGFGWTQAIHLLCGNGLTVDYFFPFHSLWHLFAAIASYLMMGLLDEVNGVVRKLSYKKSDNIRIV